MKAWQFIRKWKRPIGTSLVVLPTIFVVWYYNLLPETWSLIKELGLVGWVLYILFEYFVGRKKPSDLEKAAIQAAERKHELEVKQKKIERHRQDVLEVYNKWSSSYWAHFHESLIYGNVYLSKIYLSNSPEGEKYYKEAREDLQCWQSVYKLLIDAELLVQEANRRADELENLALQATEQLMEKEGLKEWFKGGADVGKGYYEPGIVEFLILKPVWEGSKYSKPNIAYQNDGIVIIENNQTVATLATRIKSPDEAEKLIQVFNDFSNKLNEVRKDQNFCSNLCKNIAELQSDFTKAVEAYDNFAKELKEVVIKDLENFGFPNGGRCPICLRLRP
jgi:hypothetical protein